MHMNCSIKSLLLFRTKEYVEVFTPFFPDFEVGILDGDFGDNRYDFIVINSPPYSDEDMDFINKNIRDVLLDKEGKIIIMEK